MKCPKCQTENKDGAKFCLECGNKFETKCPQCGRSVPLSAKFCDECGCKMAKGQEAPLPPSPKLPHIPGYLAEKILTSRSALEGERKQVTVLFADLKGSMELIAERDPEEARKILDAVVEKMMEAVHQYEGTVNQVMGDGIMALFGAPLAHEDHAVRACYSALRMQEAIRRLGEETRRSHGFEVQIRVGMNSGEVIVGSIGNDLKMDYTAVGQTTHLAARMEQLAIPGSVRLSAGTLRLAEGFIEAKPLGPVPVKGLAEPVEVFELLGAKSVRSRLQPALIRGLSRFVGRNSEMEQLNRALQQAGGGNGQVVAVVGEPGVGKSRLFHEFTHSQSTRGWLILEAASFSYGKATTFLPIIELLKRYFRIHDLDSPREIKEKVTGKLLTLDRSLEPTIPEFLSLLDVPADPSYQNLDPLQRRLRTLDAMKRLVLRESQVQPLLMVFEDLHWVDGETQGLLDSLVDVLPKNRILLLVNYRPEYQHSWGNKTYYHRIRLDPLQPESAGELLNALLGEDPGLERLKTTLITRTGANPLFLEESVRMLVETHILVGDRRAYRLAKATEGIQVPATVQTILVARIDRLPSEEKNLLQCAAVIGKDVPYALLKEIAGFSEEILRKGLAHLQNAEFLYETRLFPDLEYTFKHALTYEVAYGSLLQERRKTLHAAIVEAVECLYPDRIEEQIELLGRHALRGEIWDKAVGYLKKAGTRASWRSAMQEAAGFFEQALTALKYLPDTRETIQQKIDLLLGIRLVLLPLAELPRGLMCLREAEDLARTVTDERRIGLISMHSAHHFWAVGDHDQAIASAESALELLTSINDIDSVILANLYSAQGYHGKGDFRRCIELTSRNISATGKDPLVKPGGVGRSLPSVVARAWLTWALAEIGNFNEGAVRADEAIKISEAADHPFSLFHGCWGAGVLFLLKEICSGRFRCLSGAFGSAKLATLFLCTTLQSLIWALHMFLMGGSKRVWR